MSDLIINLNVNKKTDNNPDMGNSFGAYTDPNGVHTKSILKPDVYTHPYDLVCIYLFDYYIYFIHINSLFIRIIVSFSEFY